MTAEHKVTGQNEENRPSESVAAEKCECGAPADAVSFDRSICACGMMHYFCQECGRQADPCDEPQTSAAAESDQNSDLIGTVLTFEDGAVWTVKGTCPACGPNYVELEGADGRITRPAAVVRRHKQIVELGI
jgi:hypothetical protein